MKKIILLCFLMVFMVSIVSAQPPFQESTGTVEGLNLRFPPIDVLKINRDVTAHMHVFNSTNDLLLTNSSVDCFIHVYNSTGDHLIEQEMGFDNNGIDFKLKILGGNFSNKGLYSFIIWCNSTTAGGFVNGAFEVTESGFKQTTAEGLGSSIYLILILALIFLFGYMGFKLTSSDELWVFGIFLIFISLIIVVYAGYLNMFYYKFFIGGLNSSLIPEILFIFLIISITIGLMVAGLLLFKRIPAYVGKLFKGHISKGDGWDKNVFE